MAGFIERNGLLTTAYRDAVQNVLQQIEQADIRMIRLSWPDQYGLLRGKRHCCKVSDEAAFCLIQRPYISKTLLTRRISPRGSP